MFNVTEQEFRDRNPQITEGEWEIAQIDWETLLAIGQHHERQKDSLLRAAESMAQELQSIDLVHSVRFRVKDTDHLLAKIIRKRVEGSTKYADISVENYQALVTDLVGVRALHLFKEDFFRIDERIRDAWVLEETPPTAYVRDGDPRDRLKEAGFEVKDHNAGYRSVHYIVSTSPRRQKILAEIQVRTIFEEGWAEIDHTVKYPNYSNNEAVVEFLRIFNRLAGAADEMGSFVKGLAESVADMDRQIEAMKTQKEEALRDLESALTEAQLSKEQGENHAAALAKADTELKKLKSSVIEGTQKPSSKEETKRPPNSEDFVAFLAKNIDWTAAARRIGTRGLKMDDGFKLVKPIRHSTGDFLSFTIVDGDTEIPGRISGTALALLDRKKITENPIDVYEENIDRIRLEAFKMRRMNPSLTLIALGSNNFLPRTT